MICCDLLGPQLASNESILLLQAYTKDPESFDTDKCLRSLQSLGAFHKRITQAPCLEPNHVHEIFDRTVAKLGNGFNQLLDEMFCKDLSLLQKYNNMPKVKTSGELIRVGARNRPDAPQGSGKGANNPPTPKSKTNPPGAGSKSPRGGNPLTPTDNKRAPRQSAQRKQACWDFLKTLDPNTDNGMCCRFENANGAGVCKKTSCTYTHGQCADCLSHTHVLFDSDTANPRCTGKAVLPPR